MASMTKAKAPGVRDQGRPKCGARTNAETPCQRPAGWGTGHPGSGRCKLHGGSSPSGELYGSRQAADQGAREILARHGAVPVVNAPWRLREIAGEADAWRAACREQVATLNSWVELDSFGVEQAKAVVRLYTEALDRAARILVDITKLDLDTRLVRIAEVQAAAWGDVLEQVLRSSSLEAAQVDEVLRAMGRALRRKELVVASVVEPDQGVAGQA
jgi:hypothetical protein